MQNTQICCYDVVFVLMCLKPLWILVTNACHMKFMVLQSTLVSEKDFESIKNLLIFLCKNYPTGSLSAGQEK